MTDQNKLTIGADDLMALAKRLIAENLPDCDDEFMAARAHGIGSLHSEILMLAAPALPVQGDAVPVARQPQGAPPGKLADEVQYLHNVVNDVALALRNTGRLRLADLLENAACNVDAAIQAVPEATDRLLTIIASAYQIAGWHDAPEHILDVLANPEDATPAQIDAMLPYGVAPVPDAPTEQAGVRAEDKQ